MTCPFWKDYMDTSEFCDTGVVQASLSYARYDWTEQTGNNAAADRDFYDAGYYNAFPFGALPIYQIADPATVGPTGVLQTSFPIAASAEITTAFLDTSAAIADMPATTSPVEGDREDYAPVYVDFFVQFSGITGGDSVSPGTTRINEVGSNTFAVCTVTEVSTGLWRIRLTGLEDVHVVVDDGDTGVNPSTLDIISGGASVWAGNPETDVVRFIQFEVIFTVNSSDTYTFNVIWQGTLT